jgi:hypothetical protein
LDGVRAACSGKGRWRSRVEFVLTYCIVKIVEENVVKALVFAVGRAVVVGAVAKGSEEECVILLDIGRGEDIA